MPRTDEVSTDSTCFGCGRPSLSPAVVVEPTSSTRRARRCVEAGRQVLRTLHRTIDFEVLRAGQGEALQLARDPDAVLAGIPAGCEAVCMAVAAGDGDTITGHAVALLAEVDNIGAIRMAALCRQMVAQVDTGDLAATEDLAAELIESLDEVREALQGQYASADDSGSTSDSGRLTGTQRAALLELFNIGVGRSAAMLNGLAGHRVVLETPELELSTHAETQRLVRAESEAGICVVEQDYRGSFSGRVSLLFPPHDGDTLALLLAEDDDVPDEEMGEVRMETLNEVGNILVNALMGSISTLLGETLTYSVPECSEVGEVGEVDIFGAADGSGAACIRCRTYFGGEDLALHGSFVTCVSVDDIARFVTSVSARS